MLFFILSGVFLGTGALFPESYLCLVFFVISACLFKLAIDNSKKVYFGSFLSGLAFHAIAFYWLFNTVKVFGGFNSFLALIIFLLFCSSAALQFILIAWLYKKLDGSLNISLAIAWMVATMVWPKLFPWEIGHSLIVLPEISALASYFGVVPLSGLLIYFSSSLISVFKGGKLIQPAFVLVVVIFCFGFLDNIRIANKLLTAEEAEVALVQGNLSIKQKGKQKFFEANLNSYLNLTRDLNKKLSKPLDLVVWPESVVSSWIPQGAKSLEQVGLNFQRGLKTPLLFGTLGFSRREKAEIDNFVRDYPKLATPEFLQNYSVKKYNAAVAINPRGEIIGRYYKKVLMPFGEYLPFAELYPKIKAWFPMVGGFNKGELKQPIVFSNIKAFALICYEDLVPSMTRLAVRNGANLLVNLTNDAWYGHTAASKQHHLLAAFRAIESRRYFLRATNTGYTAIVNPFGNTVNNLEIFTSSVLIDKVKLLDLRTIYSYVGDIPLYLLLILFYIYSFLMRKSFKDNFNAKNDAK